jgi:hypothetical protein
MDIERLVLERSSIFDNTLTYRYSLQRRFSQSGSPPTDQNDQSVQDNQKITFMMLNPSRADAERDDPTIRACMQFAQIWGYSILEVINLFAYRTPHPDQLKQVSDPIGPDNQYYWQKAADSSHRLILAWGNHGAWACQNKVALKALTPYQDKLFCLGLNQSGHPRHPLYLKRTTQPQPILHLSL